MLFSSAELASYLQVDSVNAATAELLVELAEDLIIDLIGEAVLSSPRVRPIALEVVARAYRNPNGYDAETVDDYSYHRPTATEQAGVYLTERERSTLLAVKAGRALRSVRSVQMRSSSAPWPAGVIEER